MSVANATRGAVTGLPEPLRIAQEAIEFPEVQEMLRRLSEYNLGICMPHMHDDDTGAFQPLPAELVQVEDGLEVTFQPMEEVMANADHFVQVAWAWREGATSALAMCRSACVKRGTDTNHYSDHTNT